MSMYKQFAKAEQPGLLLHSARWYDALVWLLTFGRERSFREAMLKPAQLHKGESVLDVGCGTGSLAFLAKHQVGPTGQVFGIDASPEMVERARKKAARAGARVKFDLAPAQCLPFKDGVLDVVFSTLMLHHLPKPSRRQLADEIRRVLRPGGRALVVDFATSNRNPRRFLDRIHPRHGATPFDDIATPLSAAGLEIVASGHLGIKNLHFVLARAPGDSGQAGSVALDRADIRPSAAKSRHNGVLAALALVALLSIHAGAAAWLVDWSFVTAHGPLLAAVGASIAGALVMKLVLAVRWRRRHADC